MPKTKKKVRKKPYKPQAKSREALQKERRGKLIAEKDQLIGRYPYTMSNVEEVEGVPIVRCTIDHPHGKLIWLLQPEIQPNREIYCSGVMAATGFTGWSKQQIEEEAKFVQKTLISRVYRKAGQKFKPYIEGLLKSHPLSFMG